MKKHMYYLLVVSILFASFNSVFLNKSKLNGKNQIFFFNFWVSSIWCVILFALNKGTLNINKDVLLWGVVYGVVQALFVLFKTLAMGSGPVSVTTLIGNFSLVVSITVSLIVWKEKFSIFDLIGILLLLLALAFCTAKKGEGGYSKIWWIFSFVFFVFASCTGITFKAFGKSSSAEYCSDMMIVAALVMFVSFLLLSLLCGGIKIKETVKANHNVILLAVLSGILSCVYNRLNIFLAGKIDAVIFFPSFNGGVVLLSALLGMLICKEKLTKKQIIGILTGTVAIALIGLF